MTGSLTSDGAAPDIARVRDRLKVILFEQTSDVMEKRFGFRTPVRGGEKRRLEGLYRDTPEEWDDPYRYFGW